MANSFVAGKTFIFDHLARREALDGLEAYPKPVLECHEQWMLQPRKHSTARVEIIYGRIICRRMLQTHNLQPLHLWDNYSNVTLYLEWDNEGPGRRMLHRIVVFAMHPQLFLMPWGKRWAKSQDQAIWIGHKLARLSCQRDFYQRMHWSVINRFPRLQKYPQFKQLAQVSLQAVRNARGHPKRSSPDNFSKNQISMKSGAWSASRATKCLLANVDANSFLYSDASANSTIGSGRGLMPAPGVIDDNGFAQDLGEIAGASRLKGTYSSIQYSRKG